VATDTTMAGSVQPIMPDADSCQPLITSLQPLLDSATLLTLVMLVAEAPGETAPHTGHDLKDHMDEIERLLSQCLRRADRVLRYSAQCCAAILPGAETAGALCAIDRFRCKLDGWHGQALSLRVGLASAPHEASTLPALLALAMKPRLRLLAAGGKVDILPLLAETSHPSMDVPPEEPAPRPADTLIPFPQEHTTRATAQKDALYGAASRLIKSEGAAHRAEMFARARARALGVPYLAPPQHIPNSVRNLLPLDVMRQFQCLPIGRDRNSLTVALADPTDRSALHRLEEITGLTIFPVMTDPEALEALARPPRSRRTGQVSAQPGSGSRNRAYGR
jgi:hypothetical protein